MLNTEHCEDYLAEVKAEAEKLGPEMVKSLEEQLEYLGGYAEHGEPGRTRCDLFSDFAPLSFFFRMHVRDKESGEYKEWFVGGVIFFNRGDTGAGAPQFSCRLDSSEAGWSIHT